MFSRPNGLRISCRACAAPPLAHRKAARKWYRKWRDGFRASVASFARKRHRFDAVTVGIDDEGRIVFHPIVRAQARRTVGTATGVECGGVECIDITGRFGAKTDVG